ncbi:MAG: hypothetical protein MUF31_12090 [Akkermansiaceae bacterium]|nr:hypothetical protein [Akkermansiaceae bacterium]
MKFLLGVVAGLVVIGFLLNTWVNPWRVTPMPWSSAKLDEFRTIDNAWNRTAKAGLLRSGDWDAAIFGSSRVDIAFDPEHPLFDGMRCVNLGLNAANLVENQRIFDEFMKVSKPRLVVFAIDPGDLTTEPWKSNPTDFSLSPLDPSAAPVERECRYRFGVSTLKASIETLGRAFRKEPGSHTVRGFRRESPFPEDTRGLISGLYSATTVRLVRDRDRCGGVDMEKRRLLEDVVRQCRERGVSLVLLLTPNHALFQASPGVMGGSDPYFAWDREELARHAGPGVEVWDFLDGHEISTEAMPEGQGHFEWWIDTFHATPRLGSLVLDRIAGRPGDFGVKLQPSGVAERVREVERELSAWREARAADHRFLEEALLRYTAER